MLVSEGSETILGLDLAVIDLLTGKCDMLKANAAPTFILRDGNVYEIGSASLPIGIFEEVNIKENKCMLVDGDVIVMLSDGLLSGGSKWINEYIKVLAGNTPDSFAISNGLMTEAVKRNMVLNDDLTVITAVVNMSNV